MDNDVISSYTSKKIDEHQLKEDIAFLNKNESVENYLSLYSSQDIGMSHINTETDMLDSVRFNALTMGVDVNTMNKINFNSVTDMDRSKMSKTDFSSLHSPSGFSNNIECYEIKNKDVLFYENDEFVHSDFLKKNDKSEIEDVENVQIRENDINDNKKCFSLSNKDETNEIIHNKCSLTSNFFETIENINTKVFEKYNTLKGVSENLIEVVNKSNYEERINNLLALSLQNNEMIDAFKNKSEECIRQCRKFETSSENLISKCINTLAQASICYADWVCLHSYKIDAIDNDINDIKLFIESIQ